MSAAVAMFAACSEKPQPEVLPSEVKIEPVITRATEVNFENGDVIGLDIKTSDGKAYASNEKLSYTDGVFSSSLKWYADGGQTSGLLAYYPYSASGFPTSFKVGEDQSTGAGAYDLMTASKTGVQPQEAPVTMVFRHQLSQVVVNVTLKGGAALEKVVFKGLASTVKLSQDAEGNVTAAVDETAGKIDIVAEKNADGTRFRAIVVPQTTSFAVSVVSSNGGSLVEKFTEVGMKPGYTYTINAEVHADGIRFSLAGEIEAWQDGGTLEPDGPQPEEEVQFEEHDGYFLYDHERYNTVKMKDGKTWMADNLRYVPKGYTPCSDLKNVTAGVYCPLHVNATNTAVEFTSDEAVVKSNGYLYQSEVVLGLKVGDLTTVEAAQKLEGVQGICPKGWHIPTAADIMGLVGKSVGFSTDESAPYYDTAMGNASAALLNADGFNAGAWGAVSIQDITKTSATLMGWLSKTPDIISSGYICGSTYGGVTYNTKDDETSGVKNLQFYALMPMPGNGTYNGAKLSFRIGASVRCVKD